jgi:uncharacterized protein
LTPAGLDGYTHNGDFGDMSLIFEWDEAKANENLKKHKISFDEARTVFGDSLSITIHDTEHSKDEDRYIDIGLSNKGRLLVVVYCEREPKRIRIVSSRKATIAERKDYEEYGV